MAHTASAKKRIRQTEKRNLRNRSYKSRMKTYIKKFLEVVKSGDLEKAESVFKEAQSVIAKTASKGVIHKNNAARRVSRLSEKLLTLKTK
ncbi:MULTISPECIES: 30S ribosomal protein S20 [Calditerrivibrio]|jgi:small subunit ribosomal protein S20|uniref:Small ribosomal subunit protein bS20 n=1 Tax=Calditerrivibrio nitroreducens TaxID=477976 RepID=A0A2J6WLE8_9BACT|nr:MAG: 30S ribosomal protein S20 [Calditerrivibrio nitroreducens]